LVHKTHLNTSPHPTPNKQKGRIDVEGVVEYFPRLRGAVWPLKWLLPEAVALHATWCIVARGEDDK
jgi:hypothetical protein